MGLKTPNLDVHPLSTEHRDEGKSAANFGHLQQVLPVEEKEQVPDVVLCRLGVTGRRRCFRESVHLGGA